MIKQPMLDFGLWCDEYKPQTNHLDENASFDDEQGGIMFETYGSELEYVLSVAKTKPLNVWTYMDGEHQPIVCEGYHLVNRIGYFITEKPANPDTQYEITLS
jgi:hypothetical protein